MFVFDFHTGLRFAIYFAQFDGISLLYAINNKNKTPKNMDEIVQLKDVGNVTTSAIFS